MTNVRLSYGLLALGMGCGDASLGTRFLAELEIGPAGGTLEVSDAVGAPWVGTSLTVPSGVLTATISFAIAPAPGLTEPSAEGGAVGPALAFTPRAVATGMRVLGLRIPVTSAIDEVEDEPFARVVGPDSVVRTIESPEATFVTNFLVVRTETLGVFQGFTRTRPRCGLTLLPTDPIDFGEVRVGQTATDGFEVRADVASNLELFEVVPDQAFVVRGVRPDEPLPQGMTRNLGVSFTPTVAQLYEGTITARADGRACLRQVISVRGRGI